MSTDKNNPSIEELDFDIDPFSGEKILSSDQLQAHIVRLQTDKEQHDKQWHFLREQEGWLTAKELSQATGVVIEKGRYSIDENGVFGTDDKKSDQPLQAYKHPYNTQQSDLFNPSVIEFLGAKETREAMDKKYLELLEKGWKHVRDGIEVDYSGGRAFLRYSDDAIELLNQERSSNTPLEHRHVWEPSHSGMETYPAMLVSPDFFEKMKEKLVTKERFGEQEERDSVTQNTVQTEGSEVLGNLENVVEPDPNEDIVRR